MIAVPTRPPLTVYVWDPRRTWTKSSTAGACVSKAGELRCQNSSGVLVYDWCGVMAFGQSEVLGGHTNSIDLYLPVQHIRSDTCPCTSIRADLLLLSARPGYISKSFLIKSVPLDTSSLYPRHFFLRQAQLDLFSSEIEKF